MPLGSISFLDLAKLNASDPTIATIEEVSTFCPEFSTLMGRTIIGTKTVLPVRRQLPTAAFRKPNEGVVISKSEYDTKEFTLAFLDAQMRADIALITADNPKGRVLKNEAGGAMRAAAITVGNQLYYGNPGPTDVGFLGIQNQIDASMVVNAAGTTAATCSSVYFLVEGDDFFEMLFGNDGKITAMSDDWLLQRVYGLNAASQITSFDAFCNSLNGWIGAQIGHSKSAAVIKNITADAGKGLTDALGQTAVANFPVGMVPTKCLMTRRSRLQLQLSRTAVSQQSYQNGAIAPVPTELAGVPITVTDSILNTEAIR